MIIISSFINCITKFAKSGNILTLPVKNCSNCGYLGCLHRHGCYPRNLITFTGCNRIYIQRYKCPSCGHTCSVRPFYVLPYYQYSFFIVFSILIQIFVFKQSYSHIIFKLLYLNPSNFISASHLSFYRKRFLLCYPQVKVFLSASAVFPDFSGTTSSDFSAVLWSIVDFIGYGNNFILAYFLIMHKSFMQKPY